MFFSSVRTRISLLIIIICSAGVLSLVTAKDECPYTLPHWQQITNRAQKDLLSSPGLLTMDIPCFLAYANRCGESGDTGAAGHVPANAQRFIAGRTDVPLSFFYCLRKSIAPETKTEPQQWEPCKTYWEQKYGSLQTSIAASIDNDRFRTADSMYYAFEPSMHFSFDEYMEWFRICGTLTNIGQATRIACILRSIEPHREMEIAYGLANILTDIPRDTQLNALTTYMHFCLQKDADSIALLNWYTETCSRYGFYDEALRMRIQCDSPKHPQASSIMQYAYVWFSQRHYAPAAHAAAYTWYYLTDTTQKAMTALLVYQAYETLGNRDSASLWLSRIPLSNTNYRINAIVFLQRSGLFGRADSMIAELPSSFARDTLTLRRMVFAGYLDSALHYSVKVYAAANNSAAFVWQLRAFLFAGKGAHADSLLEAYDTAALAGNNDDVLDMRFAFTTMRTCPAAWVTYGSAACAAWQGNVARVYELLKAVQFSKYPASVGELLILTGLGTLEEAKKYVEARELMERISLSAASPEFRYRYADILELTGDSEKARALLEALLSVNPDDVYSEKARLRLREKSIVH